MSAGGTAVSAIKLNVDTMELQHEVSHHIHLAGAKYHLHKVEKSGALKGDDKAYADNIFKLRNRNQFHKEADSVVKIATDVGSLAVSMAALFALPAAPIIALGWGAVACGIAVGTKIADYFVDKAKKKTAVDEYLQLDDTGGLGMDEEYEFLDKKSKKEIKAHIREHMAAELGYASADSLYRHMIKNYAAFLHDHLFGKRDENNPPELAKACEEVVLSMGLRIHYPKNSKDKTRPTLAQIAAKLGS